MSGKRRGGKDDGGKVAVKVTGRHWHSGQEVPQGAVVEVSRAQALLMEKHGTGKIMPGQDVEQKQEGK